MNTVEEQTEGARAVLISLVESGEDLSKPRHVMYFFYGEKLAAIEQDLKQMGFEIYKGQQYWGVVERHRALEEQGFEIDHLKRARCFVAERTEVVDESWLVAVYADLCSLAERRLVNFDGWQASCEDKANGSDEGRHNAQTH